MQEAWREACTQDSTGPDGSSVLSGMEIQPNVVGQGQVMELVNDGKKGQTESFQKVKILIARGRSTVSLE